MSSCLIHKHVGFKPEWWLSMHLLNVFAFFLNAADWKSHFCCFNTVISLSLQIGCVFTLCALWRTERASCWRLEHTLAQITCLKDALEPVHFRENLVRDQCWHADELCSGVARGTMIMVRACRIISRSLMVQEELMKHTANFTRPGGTQGHRWYHSDIILKSGRSEPLYPFRKLNPAIPTEPKTATPERWVLHTKHEHNGALCRLNNTMLNFFPFECFNV